MAPVQTDLLTKDIIKQMTRDELVIMVLDFLQRFRERSAALSREDALQDNLEKAHEEIELLKEKNDSLTLDLNWSLKQKKDLESQRIPQLKQEVEDRSSHRNQLLSEVNRYRNKIQELQISSKKQARDSKLQIEKMEAEKMQVMSQFAAYDTKIEKYENQVQKLEFEVSRKIDDISIKNKEIMREKNKYRLLENKTQILEKELTEALKENKFFLKQLSKTPTEQVIDKTKEEFLARLSLSSGVILEEKLRNRALLQRLMRKEREVSKLLEQQAKTSKLLASLPQPQKETVVVKKRFEPTASDWEDLKKENKSLNYQIKALIENRERDQNRIKELTDQVFIVRKKYFSEKMKHETLKESLKSQEVKVKIDNALKGPKDENKVEINDKQDALLPPIQEATLQLPNTKSVRNLRILLLGEGKLLPDFKEDTIITPEKLKRVKSTPPRKPERPPLSPAVRRRFLRETERRKDSEQPGGSATVEENGKLPSLMVKGKNLS